MPALARETTADVMGRGVWCHIVSGEDLQTVVNELIVLIAQDLLYVLVLIAAGVWLTRDRRGKVNLAAEAVVGLVIVGIGILLASRLHSDARPFVHDPQSAPVFPHPADNGFPSDHSAAAGLLTALVLRYKRWLGAVVAAGAVAIAWARVAAHVHHAQDVVAGLGVGLAAGVLAASIVQLVVRRVAREGGRPATEGRM